MAEKNIFEKTLEEIVDEMQADLEQLDNDLMDNSLSQEDRIAAHHKATKLRYYFIPLALLRHKKEDYGSYTKDLAG